LIEMLVAISMSTLLILAISNFATSGLIGVNQDYNKTLVLTNTKEAVSVVARQIRLAKAVELTPGQADAYAPVGGWSGAAGTGTPLILAVPSRDASGNVMFIDGFHTYVYTDDVIFYLDTTTKKLYKRTLANPVAGNVSKTTCPPAHASPSCPADADVIDEVANLATSYLEADGSVVVAPAGPSATDAVTYTVTETRVINGKSYAGTYTTLATLRNR
jgi:hypothetical protein